MNEILIGKEYKSAFDSVLKLLKRSVSYGDVHVKEVDERAKRIVTNTCVFRYSENASSSENPARAMCFTPSGASWFEGLRSGKNDAGDGTAQWLGFIESVAKAYHREYSLLEFKQPDNAVSEEDMRRCRAVLEKVLELFFPSLKGVQIARADGKSEPDDIYGVSLKTEMSGGTGASVPVLGSVYFRRRGNSAEGKLNPVVAEEAAEIAASLYAAIPESGRADGADKTGSTRLIDSVILAMSRLLGGKMNHSFGECVNFGEKDEEVIGELTEKLSHDGACLECRNITVLGISHVRWSNSAFYVYRGEKPVLRAMVGLNGSVTLMCENCTSGGALIDNDNIVCRYKDAGGREVRENIRIKPNEENLGLTEEQIDKVLEYSEISRHLQSITCSENPRAEGGCTRCVCSAQLQNLGTADEPVWKCRDCPYPEIVFEDAEGELHYTPSMHFARDKMTMTEEEVSECVCCGRKFTAAVMKGTNMCPMCRAGSLDSEEGKKGYARYSGLLSPALRVRYIGKVKRCLEDEDMLVFLMGGDRYIFDKKDLEKDGYLPAPVTPLRRKQKAQNAGKEGRK